MNDWLRHARCRYPYATSLSLLVLSAGLCGFLACRPSRPVLPESEPCRPRPHGLAEHVVLVSVDGLRPDALAQAKTPWFDEQIRRGTYAAEARTILPSITLVAHASMLSGVLPEQHGITWNSWAPERGTIPVPTILDLAKRYGLQTALVLGKQKLSHLVRPGTADHLVVTGYPPEETGQAAAELLRVAQPDFLFVHFALPDSAGHRFGWMSSEQLTSIEACDTAFGEIVAALRVSGLYECTAFVITADHGGHDRTHGTDLEEDLRIPWIAAGAGCPEGIRLETPVSVCQTPATIAYLFGLKVPRDWQWAGPSVLRLVPAAGAARRGAPEPAAAGAW